MSHRKNEHAGLLAAVSLLLCLPYAAWYGFVISRLWAWFAVPIGAPHVGVWEAAGLFLLARSLIFDSSVARVDLEESPLDRFARVIAMGLIVPATVLAFGAIYHGFA